jgi:hypothetical protein
MSINGNSLVATGINNDHADQRQVVLVLNQHLANRFLSQYS